MVLLSDAPERYWSVDEVFAVVKSSAESVSRRMQFMAERGLLRVNAQTPPAYQFHPDTPELLDGANALKAEYRLRPVKVIEAIFAVPDQVRSFADAFKLKKEK
ncbi:MAG TPA: hypothetical protein VHH88_13725 [Verrucomicrobiae bacterium]|nr:hypothetical protein [Verrucomicrobiae bacterium]